MFGVELELVVELEMDSEVPGAGSPSACNNVKGRQARTAKTKSRRPEQAKVLMFLYVESGNRERPRPSAGEGNWHHRLQQYLF